MGLLYGNGVRVGLEDNLWLDAGRAQPADNPALVRRAMAMAALFGRQAASPAEVRAALGLA
jgi:uncharacterized protein (DUF849 family)